jgi:Transglutaminase-like superfamily/Coenzyme PQQ synthesis protein D (PqqD)
VPAVGARMLKETLANGAGAAATRIAAHYGVARQEVENDLTVFLSDLEKQGLLCRERSRRGAASGLARLLLRPSLKATHRLLRSPEAKARSLLALARLSCVLFGWSRTVAAWKDAHARFPARQAGERDAETIQALDRAVRTAVASHPVSVACKERSLCSWALARAAGLNASVVVGVFLFPIAGHCWCEVGSQLLGDDQERCIDYTPVARW